MRQVLEKTHGMDGWLVAAPTHRHTRSPTKLQPFNLPLSNRADRTTVLESSRDAPALFFLFRLPLFASPVDACRDLQLHNLCGRLLIHASIGRGARALIRLEHLRKTQGDSCFDKDGELVVCSEYVRSGKVTPVCRRISSEWQRQANLAPMPSANLFPSVSIQESKQQSRAMPSQVMRLSSSYLSPPTTKSKALPSSFILLSCQGAHACMLPPACLLACLPACLLAHPSFRSPSLSVQKKKTSKRSKESYGDKAGKKRPCVISFAVLLHPHSRHACTSCPNCQPHRQLLYQSINQTMGGQG
ncbi:hypothetical protein IWZ00DRAFT_126129 [Phyllosticta capitalensis]